MAAALAFEDIFIDNFQFVFLVFVIAFAFGTQVSMVFSEKHALPMFLLHDLARTISVSITATTIKLVKNKKALIPSILFSYQGYSFFQKNSRNKFLSHKD